MSSPLISPSAPTSSPRLEQISPSTSIDTGVLTTHDIGHGHRIPLSGISLCGRRWLIGADDLFIPAFISILFCTAMWALVITIFVLTYTITLPPTCHPTKMRDILLAHVIIWALTIVNDCAIAISSLRTLMFYKNRTTHPLLYIRSFIAFCITAAVIAYTYVYIHSFNDECTATISDETHILHRLSRALLILFWILMTMGVCLVTCTVGIGQVCAKVANPHDLWTTRLRRLFCCCDHPRAMSTDRDVMTSIATLFAEIFKNEENIHIVPSDILVGFALIESSQSLRQRRGCRYRFAASHLRWDAKFVTTSQMVASPTPFTPPEWFDSPPHSITQPLISQQQQHVSTSPLPITHGPEPDRSYDTNIALDADRLDVTNQLHVVMTDDEKHNNEIRPNLSIAPTITTSPSSIASTTQTSPTSEFAPYGLTVQPPRSMSQMEQDDRNIPNPEGDLVGICESGVQPQLMPQDWEKLGEARYYLRYAQAAYGCPLYMFDNISCILTCAACRPCRHEGEYKKEQFIGSGCGCWPFPQRCCHWSINAFMIQAKVKREDILFANVETSPVYYISVDRIGRRLVIACRGTLSISDLIVDLDAKLIALDAFGFPGSYTHTGIYENAIRCRDSIEKMGIVKAFMDANPDYELMITGHSLGAGTATLLTLMLRDQYQNRGLRCLALAPPLLLDAATANHPFVLDRITTIVFGNDMISRLSLSTLFQLKSQMQLAFDICAPSKFDILTNAWRRRYSRVFEPGLATECIDLYTRIRYKEIEEEKKRSEKVLQPTGSSPLLPSHGTTVVTNPNAPVDLALVHNAVIIETKDTITAITKTRSGSVEFHRHLRRCYLGGRIYHVLPVYYPKTGWFSKKPPKKNVVYPSAQETFQEIRVSRRLFLDHMPSNYWLQYIDIPQEYDWETRMRTKWGHVGVTDGTSSDVRTMPVISPSENISPLDNQV